MLPLRASIAMEDGAYAGRRTSRGQALEGSDDEGEAFEHSDDDIVGETADISRETGAGRVVCEGGVENGGQSEAAESEEESDDDRLDGAENGQAGGSERLGNDRGEEDDLEREYRELREQEE